MQCKLKLKCPLKDIPRQPINCWRPDCDGFIHGQCCNLLLDHYSVPQEERPQAEDCGDEALVFCTKTCYLKWWAEKKKRLKEAKKSASEAEVKKRKVPWEEDGSLSVLLEWLTTEGNYSVYAGSNGNVKGKSKSQFHKELALMIKEKCPGAERESKDVENKIVGLERQFRQASDWANNTGQGVDNPGDFQAALLKRCPLYVELEPIMGERPNSKPLATNEESEEEDEDEETTEENPTAVEQSCEDTPATTVATTAKGTTPSTLSSEATSLKRFAAATKLPPKKKGAHDVDHIIATMLGEDGGTQEDFHALRVREVNAREQEANARQQEADASQQVAKARMLEATAVSAKANMETDLLMIDKKVKLLRARKQLIDEGICTEENIDEYLPLKK